MPRKYMSTVDEPVSPTTVDLAPLLVLRERRSSTEGRTSA
jgi:hypothetical protein